MRQQVVSSGYERLLRPLLFRLRGGDPEAVHEATVRSLAVLAHVPGVRDAVALLTRSCGAPATVAGIEFPGRVGLAAGMDKDGLAASAWQHLGFAFAELGTVTALAQPGNPKPRVFRAPASQGLVNRMGFNNHGALALANRLAVAGIHRGNRAAGIPLGISIGKSKVVPLADAVADYLNAFQTVAPHADYVAINVSSPNTPGLRDLQDGGALRTLASELVAAGAARVGETPVPIFVKIAPDLTWPQIDEVLQVAADAGLAGVIATNTTRERDGLAASDRALAHEEGGLSGAPLTERARDVVRYVCEHTDLPVMGVGGVMSADDAEALFDAGARLVQLYTGLIFRGPALVGSINLRSVR